MLPRVKNSKVVSSAPSPTPFNLQSWIWGFEDVFNATRYSDRQFKAMERKSHRRTGRFPAIFLDFEAKIFSCDLPPKMRPPYQGVATIIV